MVRSKPSKQPFGLVVHGVPIEKVWPKAMRHSDWAHGAAGTPQGRLGRSNFGQGHVFMVHGTDASVELCVELYRCICRAPHVALSKVDLPQAPLYGTCGSIRLQHPMP